jgi:hypothetical protein
MASLKTASLRRHIATRHWLDLHPSREYLRLAFPDSSAWADDAECVGGIVMSVSAVSRSGLTLDLPLVDYPRFGDCARLRFGRGSALVECSTSD